MGISSITGRQPQAHPSPNVIESYVHTSAVKVPHVQPEDFNVLVEMKFVEAYDPKAFIKPLAGTTGSIAFESPIVGDLGDQTGPPVASPLDNQIITEHFSKVLKRPVTKFRHPEAYDVTVAQPVLSHGNLRVQKIEKLSLRDTMGLKKQQAHNITLNVLDFNNWISTRTLIQENTKVSAK